MMRKLVGEHDEKGCMMRALYFPQSLIEHEAERVLDDLARWTNIDTLLVGLWNNTPQGDRLRLPAADGGDFPLPLPVVGEEEFDSFTSVLEMARSKGFRIGCHFCPLFAYTRDLLALRNETLHQPPPHELPHGGLIWACPNNPAAVQYAVAVARSAAAAWQPAELLALNHVEYPLWPHRSLGSILTCFCRHCQDTAQAAGIDFAAVKRETAALLEDLTTPPSQTDSALPSPANLVLNHVLGRPHIAQWLAFRMASMSQFVRTVTLAAREAAAQFNPELKIGMDVFLPSAANLVGTDFAALYPLFDWIAPKFPDYLSGSIVPMIADEMNTTGASARTTALREGMRQILDLGPGPANYEPSPSAGEELLYHNTLDATIVDRQMSYLNPLTGKIPMYPWIWLYNHDLSGLQDKFEALGRNGFEGFCLWLWEPDMTTAALKKAQGVF